jgi:molecular chaperone DnaK (HSP70)
MSQTVQAKMALHVGLDFGTSNSGVAIYQGDQVHVLPIDGKNIVPEVVKTILYITQDFQHFIGQEAVELYYKQNINQAGCCNSSRQPYAQKNTREPRYSSGITA